MSQLQSALKENAIAIALFAVVTAGIIAVTQVSTADLIAENERQAEAKALYEVVPELKLSNDLLADFIEVDAAELVAGRNQTSRIHLARQAGEVVAVVVPVISAEGYSGDIKMIVGIDRKGIVTGVRVLAHKETPGLGDKVDLKKSSWVLSFKGQSKLDDTDDWAVKKDGGRFDQFTGATITPRAVVGGVGAALDYFQAHRDQLLGQK